MKSFQMLVFIFYLHKVIGIHEATNKNEDRFNESELGLKNFYYHVDQIVENLESSKAFFDLINDTNYNLTFNSRQAIIEPLSVPLYWSNNGNLEGASISNMNRTMRDFFSKVRNQLVDPEHLESVRTGIIGRLAYYTAHTHIQHFEARDSSNQIVKGVNLIGIMPGLNYHQGGDNILVVGAHYDTTTMSPGVNDNGSGMTALLECARILSPKMGDLNNTIIFVAFDQEEKGCLGSMAFVNQYLIAKELRKYRSSFTGAYIMDMIMNYDPNYRSQMFPIDFTRVVPEATLYMRRNKNMGDFLAVFTRRGLDDKLWQAFSKSWNKVSNVYPHHKILNINPSIPRNPTFFTNYRYRSFMRSDHSAFWNNKNLHYDHLLPAALITDTGPFRGIQRACYHEFCDNVTQATPQNMEFMKHIVDVLSETLLDLSCY